MGFVPVLTPVTCESASGGSWINFQDTLVEAKVRVVGLFLLLVSKLWMVWTVCSDGSDMFEP